MTELEHISKLPVNAEHRIVEGDEAAFCSKRRIKIEIAGTNTSDCIWVWMDIDSAVPPLQDQMPQKTCREDKRQVQMK